MADLIQFHCPACGALLRLPLEMAGSEGPCPRCTRKIVAPVPHRGLGARIGVPQELVPRLTTERAILRSNAPAAAAIRQEVSPTAEIRADSPASELPQVTPMKLAENRHPPQTAVFVLAVMLTAVVSLIAGFLLGHFTAVTQAPIAPVSGKSGVEDPVALPEPAPKVVLVKPPVETAPIPAPTHEPAANPAPPTDVRPPAAVRSSEAAEAALKAFLDAPDWMTRSAHVMSRDRVRAAMESYSHKMPDGPTSYQSIKRKDAFLDSDSGTSFFVFYVHTDKHPDGFPTVVAESQSGWLVDWEAFVEFRDDQFKSFHEGPNGQSGKFHLLVTAPSASKAANTENEYFTSFLIGPPGTETAKIAYVKKNTEACRTLTDATKQGAVFAPVLEISKRGTPEGKSYLEIDSVAAPRWLPERVE